MAGYSFTIQRSMKQPNKVRKVRPVLNWVLVLMWLQRSRSKIIAHVLTVNERLARGTDHYIDEIYVDESIVRAEVVKSHLAEYGLVCKEPVPLNDTRVLGLRVVKDDRGIFRWARDGDLPVLSKQPTKRELFSVCGKLIGH